MTHLTDLEKLVLNNITLHEMNEVNGANEHIETVDHTITFYWPEDFAKGLEVNQVRGVVTSLVKKGLVVVQEDIEHNTIWLTEEGLVAWKSVLSSK